MGQDSAELPNGISIASPTLRTRLRGRPLGQVVSLSTIPIGLILNFIFHYSMQMNYPSIWLMILSGQPKIVSASFGLDNIENVKNGISFRVNGRKYTGTISIVADNKSNSFIVNYTADSNPNVSETLETITFADLVAYNTNPLTSLDSESLESIQKEYGFIKM